MNTARDAVFVEVARADSTIGARWRDRAACAGVSGEAFAPDPDPALTRCGTCPVTVDCLAWALEAERYAAPDNRHGVWGATTPAVRAALDRAAGHGWSAARVAAAHVAAGVTTRTTMRECADCSTRWPHTVTGRPRGRGPAPSRCPPCTTVARAAQKARSVARQVRPDP